jgi:hypothetical protein
VPWIGTDYVIGVGKAASKSRLLSDELYKSANLIEGIFLCEDRVEVLGKIETTAMFKNTNSKYEYTVDN